MSNHAHDTPTLLFTVRFWTETTVLKPSDIRGRARNVMTGEVIHFDSWPVLTAYLEESLAAWHRTMRPASNSDGDLPDIPPHPP